MTLLDRASPFPSHDVPEQNDVPTQGNMPVKGTDRSINRSNTYIMQGPAAQRAVTTYHLILAPTHACNLRCEHCYLPDHAPQTLNQSVVLRLLQEWNEIIGEETPGRRGIFHVKGGEPLVYKPILSILKTLRKFPHLHFMMTTNGTLFQKSHWRVMSSLNESSDGEITVIVSLDGATAGTHELLRGIGTFEPTINAVRKLQQHGIRTYINSVLHTENVHEIDGLVDLALQHDVAQLNFLPFVPKGFGQDIRRWQLPHRVAYERLRECYLALPEDKRTLLAGSLPDIIANEKGGYLVVASECVAAYRGLLYIKPDGYAYTCPNLEAKQFSMGNVNLQSLRTILDGIPKLYDTLHSDRKSDRYICMGERKLYEQSRDASNLLSLTEIRDDISPSTFERAAKLEMKSFCVSRNW